MNPGLFLPPDFCCRKDTERTPGILHPAAAARESLYGTEFEVRLRNELKQKAVAKECAAWMQKKVHFKSNTTNEGMNNFLLVQNPDQIYTYMPLNAFTTVDLGCERGNNLTNMVTQASHIKNASLSLMLNRLRQFKYPLSRTFSQIP